MICNPRGYLNASEMTEDKAAWANVLKYHPREAFPAGVRSLPALFLSLFFPNLRSWYRSRLRCVASALGRGWRKPLDRCPSIPDSFVLLILLLSLLTSVCPSTVHARWKQHENVYPPFPIATFSLDIHTNIWRGGTKPNECSSSDNGDGDANIFLRADITHRALYPLKMGQAGNRSMFSRRLIHLWRTDASWVMKDNENVLGCL